MLPLRLTSLFSFLLAITPTTFAASLTVDTLADSGTGSLRQAILDANGNAGTDDIEIDGALEGILELVTPLPVLTESVNILGPGAHRVTVDANGHGRVLDIQSPAMSTTRIEGLTLTGGHSDTEGGGIRVFSDQSLVLEEVRLLGNIAGAAPSFDLGGGLYANPGTDVTLRRCTVAHNRASMGAGLAVIAPLLVEKSTFYGNHARLQGGAIRTGGELTLVESTISGNTADTDGSVTFGGGLDLLSGAMLTMYQTTLVGNSADIGPGIQLWAGASVVDVGGCVLAGNLFAGSDSEGNCSASLGIADQHNLSGDASCGFTGTSDLENTTPDLWALAWAGGLTPTHVPKVGSPVLDAGLGDYCLSVDQRDQPRPVDGDDVPGAVCDLGATEHQGASEALLSADGFESGDLSAWAP